MVNTKNNNVWVNRWEESALKLQQKRRQKYPRRCIDEQFNSDSWQDCLEKADKNRIDDPKDWVSDDEEEYCHIADIELLHTNNKENMEDFSSTEQSKHEEQCGVKHVLRNNNEVHDLCIVGDTICIEEKISRCDDYTDVKSNIVGKQKYVIQSM